MRFSFWHSACDVSFDDGHGLTVPAGRPDRMWRQCYGYLRCAEYLGWRPAGSILRAAEHFRQHRERLDHRLQGHRYQLRGSRSRCDVTDRQVAGGVTALPQQTHHHRRAPSPPRRSPPTWRSTATASSRCRSRPASSTTQPVFNGVTDYTRRGDFQVNANGNLVNGAGYYLMGVAVDPKTGNPLGNVPQVLQFQNNFVPAQATTVDSIRRQPSDHAGDHGEHHGAAPARIIAAGGLNPADFSAESADPRHAAAAVRRQSTVTGTAVNEPGDDRAAADHRRPRRCPAQPVDRQLARPHELRSRRHHHG